MLKNLKLTSFLLYLFISCVYVGLHACMCATVHLRRPDNFGELVFSFQYVGPRDQTQALGLGCNCLPKLTFSMSKTFTQVKRRKEK